MTLRVLEAFTGVGSQRMALRNLGIDHEVVAIAEIDKFAIKSYEAIHGETNNLGDISQIETSNIPDHDLFTYSFPCQDISVAGKGLGLDEGSDTRSGLLWECQKVIAVKKPKYLLLENVKNLVGKRHKPNFDKWLEWLEDQGYTNYWQVLNAKHYGVPQNRERVFVVSILGNHEPYEFPEPIELELRLKDILESEVDEKFYLDEEKVSKLIINSDTSAIGYIPRTNGTQHQSNTIYKTDAESPSMQARDYKDPVKVLIKNATKKGYLEATHGDGVDLAYPESKTRRGRVQSGLSQTLDTGDSKGVVIGRSIGRNPENPSDGTVGGLRVQRLEINKQGTSNTLTTFQKDNYAVEPEERTDYIGENETYTIEVLRTLQKEIGKEAYAEWEDRGLGVLREKEILRQDLYEERLDAEENRETQERKVKPTECENEGGVFYRDKGVSEVFIDEKSRRSPYRSESYEQFARQLGSFMQELSYEESSQEKVLSDLWRTAEGVGSVRQALHQIQKIWRPELYKISDLRIRKLSPLETWRLMGFSDEDFHKAEAVNSNSQLYKQAGNSIVVPVLEAIFKQLVKEASE